MTYLKKLTVYFLITPLFSLTGFAATELAKINNKVITLEEFNKKYESILPMYPNAAPSKKTILEEVIKREIGIQEAKKLRLDQDPEVMDEINTVLYQALIRKSLSKEFDKINVSDSEAKSYYEKNPEIRTSHIFVALSPTATKDEEQIAYKRIKEIQEKELRSGKSFAEVAQKFSDGVAAPMGGDIDYQTKEKLDPTYYKAALGLGSPGKVSGIIRSQYGFHIIKLTAVRPWSETNKVDIKRSLVAERKKDLFDRYMSQLKSKASVSVKNSLLN